MSTNEKVTLKYGGDLSKEIERAEKELQNEILKNERLRRAQMRRE